MIHEWAARSDGEGQHLADVDDMVACRVGRTDTALELRQGTLHQRHADRPSVEWQTIELLRAPTRAQARDLLLILGEDADAEVPARLETRDGCRPPVEADED
jgi:hypothetical protein